VRRARAGGSWLVRVALARVGQWIADRGLLPQDVVEAIAPELPEEELQALMGEMETPAGRIRYLRPVVQLSQTPPYWSRPPVPLGTHAPAWPERHDREHC
jgi:hypothetical protein